LGKPNALPSGGSTPVAWSPYWTNAGKEWIEVGFAKPQQAAQIAVAESFNPGAITKIIAIDTRGKEHTVYQNKHPKPAPVKARVFRVYPRNANYEVKAVRVVLNTTAVPGYNHIDAIGISTSTKPVEVRVNLASLKTLEEPENLGSNINSKYAEVHPLISPDGQTLYFTRKEHPENTGPQKRDDIWFSTQDGSGHWSKAKNLGSPLNSPGHNFMNSISPDGNMALIGGTYENFNAADRLYISYRNINGWSQPKEIQIDDYYNLSEYNSFQLAVDGKTLLMSVKRKDSYGNKDIYVSFMKPDHTFSTPVNLGPDINTAGDEVTPFLAPDGVTLYFSSNGWPGYGSNDIFMSRRLDDTWQNWSEPKNLGPAINTSDWDAYYTVEASGEFAYFTSYQNSLGSADIFRIRLQESQKPEAVTLLSGRVLDATDSTPVQAKIVYNRLPDGENLGYVFSTAGTGAYQLILTRNTSYSIEAQADGYYSVLEKIDLADTKQYEQRSLDLYLYPVRKGNIIPLNNIFFEVNESTLKPESFVELDRAVQFLKTNPGVRVEVAGHTNNRCSAAYCLQLSENRAKAVAEYLIAHGVEPERVKYRGYGKDRPIDTNETEAGRQRNQRVEFRILDT